MKNSIRHMVVFSLIHPADSTEEQHFLSAAEQLCHIPGVEKFEILREISPKNAYSWGISMEFLDQNAYQYYNNHPQHQAFIQDWWQNNVAMFQEIDFEL